MDMANNDYKRVKVVSNLQEAIVNDCNFVGYKDVRTQALIQSLALTGILQIKFYSYIPMHLSGGPSEFLNKYMSWSTNPESNDIIAWSVSIVQKMKELYSADFDYAYLKTYHVKLEEIHRN